MLSDKALQSGALDFPGRVQRTAGTICLKDSAVEKVELWMRRQLPLCPLRENLQTEPQKQVFEYFKIAFAGLRVHAA